MIHAGMCSFASHRTRDSDPQNMPNASPTKSTIATVSFGTRSKKLWRDGRREIRAVLESAERVTGRRRRSGVALGVRSFRDPLQDRRGIEVRSPRAQIQIAKRHEPVAVIAALVVDRGCHDPALEPLGPTTLLEDARRVCQV